MILSDFLTFNFQELPNTFSVEYNQDFSDFKAELFYKKKMMKNQDAPPVQERSEAEKESGSEESSAKEANSCRFR